MIVRNEKELNSRYYILDKEPRSISYVYYMTASGLKLIWQAISSCFGSGAWINEYGWKNTDGWKNK